MSLVKSPPLVKIDSGDFITYKFASGECAIEAYSLVEGGWELVALKGGNEVAWPSGTAIGRAGSRAPVWVMRPPVSDDAIIATLTLL